MLTVPFLRSASAPSPTTPLQFKLVEDFLALLQEIFASLESPKATILVKSRLTPAQERRIEINRQNAIRCRNERLNQHGNELHPLRNSSLTGSNRSPNSLMRDFYMNEKNFCSCLSCHKFFHRIQHPTKRFKIDCDYRKTVLCGPCKNFV